MLQNPNKQTYSHEQHKHQNLITMSKNHICCHCHKMLSYTLVVWFTAPLRSLFTLVLENIIWTKYIGFKDHITSCYGKICFLMHNTMYHNRDGIIMKFMDHFPSVWRVVAVKCEDIPYQINEKSEGQDQKMICSGIKNAT